MQLAKQTLRSEEGKKVLDYLKDKRGLSDDVIDKFDIGYCPDRINHEVSGRIIIPIYDSYGNLVVLSTRHPDRQRVDRFWHESFDKRTYLFALDKAKESILKIQKAIVVEGEFDVCSLHSRGVNMVVGSCGSNFSLFQISLLIRYCSEIYLMFDGDEAGERATQKTIEIYKENELHQYGIDFIPVRLPKGFDPDDFIFKEGVEGMMSILKKSKEEYNCKRNDK